MRKITSLLLALVLVFGTVIFTCSTEALASTAGHTQAEAVAWTNAKIGTAIDYDGVYGVQCVDLVNMYYAYLGQRLGSIGYAYNLSASVPAGWQVLGNNCDPRPGDIFVWRAYEYGAAYTGHTGIITEVRSNSYVFVDYNGGGRNDGGTPHEKSGVRSFSYLVRPDFAVPVVNYSLDVNVILDGCANNSGISGLTFDVYINGSKKANDVKDYCTTFTKGTTYKVDDIKVSGSLIYTGNNSYSGTLNSNAEVKLPVKTGYTVKSDTAGQYKITIPANYQFDLYSSATAVSRNRYALPSDHSYSFFCDHKYVLSDGSVRYRYNDNGEYRYFKFTSAMSVQDSLKIKTKETGTYKITVPANLKVLLYSDVTSFNDTHFYPARDTSYTISCTEKHLMSDGSVRYGFSVSGTYYYLAYSSKLSVDEGCSKGHTYTTDSTKLAKAATCTAAAKYYKRCSKCGEYSTETFTKGSPLGHSYTNDTTKLAKAATCTAAAKYYKRCSRCGEYSTETFSYGSALGHIFTATNEIADPATCTTPARYFKKCSRCGVYDEPFHLEEKGSPLGHNYTKTSTVSPTCTADGYSVYKCSRCSNTYKSNITPATGHKDSDGDGRCDACAKVVSSGSYVGNTNDPVGETTDPAAETADSGAGTYCDCPCHSGGSIGRIWNVLMIICRILGIREFRYCDCGTSHF